LLIHVRKYLRPLRVHKLGRISFSVNEAADSDPARLALLL
jgi:hypothetical protein